MYNLYNKEDNLEIIERIQKVNRDSVRQWGKMSAAEMLFHCRQPLRVGFGEMKLKRTLLGILFGKIAKKQVLDGKPIKKGLPTDKNFKPKDNHDLETEKAALIKIVGRFAADGPGAITKEPHPFFGRLTPEEWSILTWKHLDHHLTQFGA
ncbi:MAG: DUF1569 domain-containing protein [Ignavibacteria bacterium]|nr:DUF1569 domain-containing protein [Ignavibacteria bacterium]